MLGADTTVTLDSHILAKPEDAADAVRMLRLLSGRTHRVITGVAVATSKGTEVAAEVTGVQFLALSDEEIAAYIATGEPMDKAGAYGIQGLAAKWIPRIEGCYFNVVGLPLALVSAMLEAVKLRTRTEICSFTASPPPGHPCRSSSRACAVLSPTPTPLPSPTTTTLNVCFSSIPGKLPSRAPKVSVFAASSQCNLMVACLPLA